MYKISVPTSTFVLEHYGKEALWEELKKLDCERLFICPNSAGLFNENREKEFAIMKESCAWFQAKGLEVGMWIWAYFLKAERGYRRLTNPFGQKSATQVCATDLEYRKVIGKILQDGARCGFDLLMFDDDFRYGFHDIGFGCCCENHLKMMEEELGEAITLDKIRPYLLSGAKNKYRDAFVKGNAQAYVDFAKAMRQYVDEVDPNLRLGFCACITSWDLDGTTPDQIAQLLAGKTKPFYRLIGAPYWGALRTWGLRPAESIELERLEATRRENSDIEMFSEGDVFPRPRFRVGAAYLEGFDTALRAAGCTDGILKYALDYTSHPQMETGYRKAHEHNRDVYEQIDRLFSGKEPVGIRVWDKAAKYADMTIPAVMENSCSVEDMAFSPAVKMLTSCSLPVTYGAPHCAGAAFGEDVKAVPKEQLGSGLILDLRACELLMEQGIDVGIEQIGEERKSGREHTLWDDNHVALDDNARVRTVKLKPNAKIESTFVCEDDEIPASFRYENKDGQKFFVLCFDGYFNSDALFRTYARAKQLAEAAAWLSGEALPAVCFGNPDLYIQTKQNGNRLAVGLWNFSTDEIFEPTVQLTKSGTVTGTIRCTAQITKSAVTLSPLAPYAFAGFEVELA